MSLRYACALALALMLCASGVRADVAPSEFPVVHASVPVLHTSTPSHMPPPRMSNVPLPDAPGTVALRRASIAIDLYRSVIVVHCKYALWGGEQGDDQLEMGFFERGQRSIGRAAEQLAVLVDGREAVVTSREVPGSEFPARAWDVALSRNTLVNVDVRFVEGLFEFEPWQPRTQPYSLAMLPLRGLALWKGPIEQLDIELRVHDVDPRKIILRDTQAAAGALTLSRVDGHTLQWQARNFEPSRNLKLQLDVGGDMPYFTPVGQTPPPDVLVASPSLTLLAHAIEAIRSTAATGVSRYDWSRLFDELAIARNMPDRVTQQLAKETLERLADLYDTEPNGPDQFYEQCMGWTTAGTPQSLFDRVFDAAYSRPSFESLTPSSFNIEQLFANVIYDERMRISMHAVCEARDADRQHDRMIVVGAPIGAFIVLSLVGFLLFRWFRRRSQ